MNAIVASELNYCFMQGIKPNFSELSRKYDIDRHTLKKHYESGGQKQRKKRTYSSMLDKYYDVIVEKLKISGITYIGIYKLLVDRYSYKGSYSLLKNYIMKKGLKKEKTKRIHIRYETPPANQLQVDWKENLKIITKHGEVIEFNLFAATLGYSRLHKFVYSESKTREGFMRCLIDTLYTIGGLPEEILTDNMKAIVSIEGNKKYKYNEIIQFEKDLGIKIRLCKVRTPETKGKVESSNRFVNRLLAYNNEIEDKNELIKIIDKLNKDINEEINQETNVPPIVLFKKEKKYLKPLPNNHVLDSYIVIEAICTVPSTLLVPFHGSKYSVPAKYLNKRVKLIKENNLLYIYYNTELIRTHEISKRKNNYNKEDYYEGIKQSIKRSEKSIEEITEENLKLLGDINK